MRKMKGLFAALVTCAAPFSGFASEPVGLKTNHLVEPGHVDGTPVFSWRMESDRPGACQTAYRLKVEGVWDSGVVEDGKSVGIAFAGRPLESARRYRWTVAVRDETGAWRESKPATFSTGVVTDGDWGGARWIAPATAAPHGYKTALFRRAFGVTKSVREAWWTVTGAGVFVPVVNGRPVTDEALLPGATHALKVRQACTYDVTDLLTKTPGATNVLGATVSTGWFRDRIAARNRPGRRLDPSQPGAFRAVLVLRHADGSEERLATDESWQATEGGPLVAAGIYEGETFDARQTVDWSGADWPAARPDAHFAGIVRNFRGPPVSLRRDLALKPVAAAVVNGAEGASETSFGTARVRRRFAAGEPMTLAPGEQLVVDFGQNASAVPEFVLSAEAGAKVEVRHAEMLNEGRGEKARGNDGPAGTPYLSNLRTSFAGIRYTCRGGESESYRPAFTFFGYRYIGVTADRPLTVWRVTSVPVTSVPQDSDTGTLETDNPRINRLLANCRWGMYSNYLSVPTDCPQRDERVGWTADTQVFAPAATYLADVSAFLSKWMGDMRDSQRADGCFSQIAPENAVRGAVTGWTDAGVIVPYVLWRRIGDATVVRENWSAMVRYLDYVEKRGAQDAQPYGDWLSYEYGADMEWLKPVREQRQLPRKRVLNAAYRVWIGRMMAEMAEAIGETAAAAKYRAFADRETERFRRTCLKPDGTLLADCDGQCSALFALYLKLLPHAAAVEETKRDLRANFRRSGDCLRTGFLGTSILLDAVTEGLGDLNLAYTLLLQDKNPSWLYSVDQGATTIWERWNSYTKADGFGPVSMNSFNHYAYGAVADWMFSTMAGIRAEEPGFRRIRFAPKPDGRIGRVSAAFDSPYGTIRSSWRREGTQWIWEGEVPPNASAILECPDGSVRLLQSGRHREILSTVSQEVNGRAQWVNGGSNTGLFGYDWSSAGVRGLNLAGSPQSMRRDMEKLKARRGEIDEGAYVIFTLCPFTSVLTEAYDLRPSSTTHALIGFDGIPDTAALEGFRRQLIDCWKEEFAIRDLGDPMTESNRAAYRKMVSFARASVAWCRKTRLTPVFVLPPAARCFDDVFTDGFLKAYVEDFVRDVGGDVPFFNYWKSPDFRDDRLFANALFLNRSGRAKLTARTIADIRRHFGR